MREDSGEATDPPQEYQRLLRFLTRPGPRFGLGLVRFGDSWVANRLRSRLAREVGAEGLRVGGVVFEGGDASADLVGRMSNAIVDGELDVLFVVGLEKLLVDESGKAKASASISNLNQRRDSLRDRLSARVVFWIPEAVFAAYAEQLPDLHGFMLTVVRFGLDANELVPEGEAEWQPGEPPTEDLEQRIHGDLMRAIETLSDAERDVLLTEMESMTDESRRERQAAVAGRLGMSVSEVERLSREGWAKVGKELRKFNADPSLPG